MADKPHPKDDVASDLSAFMKDMEENVRIDGDIPYPIEVARVIPQSKASRESVAVGTSVAIRPVKDNPEKKTYLGVYLGDLPIKSATTTYHLKTKELTFLVATNPAIFVPDLNLVVWGYESWWGPLRNRDQLRQITDGDIQNVWYVKALTELVSREPPIGQTS